MKKLVALLALIILAVTGCAQTPETSESYAMNTICTQTIYADQQAIAQNNRIIADIERRLSKTDKNSDVWKLNNSAGEQINVDEQTAFVLKRSIEAAEQTSGAFNPALGELMNAWGFGSGNESVPHPQEIKELLLMPDYKDIIVENMQIKTGEAVLDFGGVAKGYALDEIRNAMDEQNVGAGLVSLGGSIYARGKKPDGASWSIGIRNPLGGENDWVAKLNLQDECISTSGAYERGFEQDGKYYHHILDPKTGYPASGDLISVSVIDKSGIDTDIFSTALFVMGAERGLKFAEENGIEAIFINKDKKLLITKNFGRALEIKDSSYETEAA